MSRLIQVIGLSTLLALAACGGTAPGTRANDARTALTSNAEMLEFDTVASRQALYREAAQISLVEQGREAQQRVLFPVVRGGELLAAPGFSATTDLIHEGQNAAQVAFTFDGSSDRWPEDRRESLQMLSEREAAELVARALLTWWNIQPAGSVQIDRASGVPYAVAYVDGIMSVNPAFLYLAASVGISSQAD
jgi:hypothetical protein